MSPSDSPASPTTVMRSRRQWSRSPALRPGTRRGLSGSWWLCRRLPFPTTPGSSTAASARCLAADVRFRRVGKVDRSQIRLSRGRSGFACATADVFAFSGFDGVVTRAAAESATWRTSNFHGQFLSTDKIHQTYPDAPDRSQFRGASPFRARRSVRTNRTQSAGGLPGRADRTRCRGARREGPSWPPGPISRGGADGELLPKSPRTSAPNFGTLRATRVRGSPTIPTWWPPLPPPSEPSWVNCGWMPRPMNTRPPLNCWASCRSKAASSPAMPPSASATSARRSSMAAATTS